MTIVNVYKRIAIGTILSILVFFSISFVDFLAQIPPIVKERTDLNIGFPFTYFQESYPRGCYNYGWLLKSLINDCLITWILITGIYLILTKKK
jgi:hypothetical protein